MGILGARAEEHDSKLIGIFPEETEEDENRFELLDYAYIGGRYDHEYRISKEDLEILAEDVSRLLKITEETFLNKIKSFI